MTRQKASLRWILALSLALSPPLMACRRSTKESAANPKVKDTFVFAPPWEPNNLDPVTQDGSANVWTFMNVYQTLIRLNVAGTAFEPDLAESWNASADGLAWTFRLRHDARFSNGTGVTSKDVLFSLKRSREIKGPWQSFMADVAGIEAPDDYTVVITLKQKSAPFPTTISLFSNAVLSADFFKDAPPDKLSTQMMGSGPYMMTEWKRGEYISLAANPHYHEKGLPRTPHVKLVTVSDPDTRIIKLQSGEIDGIGGPPFARIAELRANPSLQVQLNPCMSVTLVVLNVRTGPLANPDFRKALAYATDREGLIKAMLFGNGTPATSFLTPTTLYFDKDLKGYTFDVDKAKAHMAKSGVPAGTRIGIVVAPGELLPIALKDMWGKLGLDVQLRSLEGAAINARMTAGDFEVYTGSWNDDIPDPSQLAFYELGYPQPGFLNSGYHSDKMNQLIDAGVRELDPVKRAQIYKDIQTLAIEDSPNIWLYYTPFSVALSKKVEGFAQMTTGPWVLKNVVVKQSQ